MILIAGEVMGPLIGLLMEVETELMESRVVDLVLGELTKLLERPMMGKMERKWMKIRRTMQMTRRRGDFGRVSWFPKALKVKLYSCILQIFKVKVILPYCHVAVVADKGGQFVTGLSDAVANVGEQALLSCKLSSATAKGQWYKNGKLVSLKS